MNNINLINGDCLDILKQIKDNSVDLVLTDPPYKTISGGDSDGINSKRPSGIMRGNRELFKHKNVNHNDWLLEVYRVLKNGSHFYCFTNSLNLSHILSTAENCGFKLHNILVWEKNNCTPSQYYMKNCEYILFMRKGKAKYINNIGDSKTVHAYKNIIGNKLHPTEKPTNLLEFYINNSSNENDIILDPFMGSGSTGVACLNTNRQFIGIELDEKYFNIAKDRVENYKNT